MTNEFQNPKPNIKLTLNDKYMFESDFEHNKSEFNFFLKKSNKKKTTNSYFF